MPIESKSVLFDWGLVLLDEINQEQFRKNILFIERK